MGQRQRDLRSIRLFLTCLWLQGETLESDQMKTREFQAQLESLETRLLLDKLKALAQCDILETQVCTARKGQSACAG